MKKIVLITGVETGIGKATAERFISEGAFVYGVSTQSNQVVDFGENLKYIILTSKKEEEICDVVTLIEKEQGHLDSLITIGEKWFRNTIATVSAKDIEEANYYNLELPMLFTKYATKLLKLSTNPSITFDVPMSAYMTEANYLNSSYAVALINYTRQATSQIRPIRCNSVMFGIIKDHLLNEEELAVYNTPERLAKIPCGRLGEPKDVSGVNYFLASDKERYLNSGAWSVDGGYYTMNPRSMGNNGI